MGCKICLKEMGMFSSGIKIKDGWICKKCYEKAGFSTWSTAQLQAVEYITSENIARIIQGLHPLYEEQRLIGMRTVAEMEDFLTKTGFSAKSNPEKHLPVIEKSLFPDEKVVLILAADYLFGDAGTTITGSLLVAFTNQRIIGGQKRTSGSEYISTVDLNIINGVTKQPSLTGDRVVLATLDKDAVIGIPSGIIDRVYDAVCIYLKEYKNEKTQKEVPTVNSAPADSLSDFKLKVEKLRAMKDAGLLTDTEFLEERDRLLKSI